MNETMSEMTAIAQDEDRLHRRVEAFLYREARLQDRHDYDAWQDLWEDDAIYWVPANDADIDPEEKMSIIYDNRSRIRVRIDQLKTGRRHTQTPRSSLARLVSNVEVTEVDGNEVSASANVMIFEDNLRGETVWAAQVDYRLRLVGRDFRLVRKKVCLVNAAKPIYTLSFLV